MSRFPSRPQRQALAALLACGLAACAHADPRIETLGVPQQELPATAQGKPPSWASQGFRQGVVTAANPYGAEAGARMLEQGGNAVDAAVAIAYALNVVEPQSAGIGGGGFMMIHLAATGETIAIDSRERAPAGATPDMFVGVQNASLNGVAVGVPGMVRGTALALQKYGKLPLSTVLQPAIKLAADGFAATPRYVEASCSPRARNSPESEAYFCPGGVAPAVGALIKNTPLAGTLQLIAEHGADCFYVYMPDKGCDIAKGVVEGQKFVRPGGGGKGGSMTFADLEGYEVSVRQPVTGTYRGYTLKAMSPPSSGALTVIQMLKMLERFPIGDANQGFGFASVNTLTAMAEAMRVAFADRSIWMGDADFAYVPAKGLLHPTYVAERSTLIEATQRNPVNPTPGDPRQFDVAGVETGTRLAAAEPVNGPGETTTHFSVVDRWGNMVSYTNTIESGHGIGVFAGYRDAQGNFRNHGFLLNNELTDFNLAPTVNPYTGEAGTNDVEPHKRPRSSMTPAMLFAPDGRPMVAYGSPGGATIINSVFNVTLNLVDHKMSIQEAINAPRLSVTAAGGNPSVDFNMPQAAVDALTARGYTVSRTDIGSVQAVVVDLHTGKQYGGADPRREGTVIGLPRAGNGK